MRTAFVMITTACNNRCAFCFNRHQPPGIRTHLSLAAFRDALSTLMQIGFHHYVLTGGEPLLHPDLDGFLAELERNHLSADVISNGTLLDEKRARSLAEAFSGTLIVSLNDIHNRLTDPAVFLQSITRRLELLARFFSGRLSTIFVFTKTTHSLIPDVLRVCREINVGLIFQPAFVPRDLPECQEHDPLTLPEKERRTIIEGLRLWADRYGPHWYVQCLEALGNGRNVRPDSCLMGSRVGLIDTDLTVYPCFHRRDLPAGRLLAQSAAEIDVQLKDSHKRLADAPCFGEHCVSLFVG